MLTCSISACLTLYSTYSFAILKRNRSLYSIHTALWASLRCTLLLLKFIPRVAFTAWFDPGSHGHPEVQEYPVPALHKTLRVTTCIFQNLNNLKPEVVLIQFFFDKTMLSRIFRQLRSEIRIAAVLVLNHCLFCLSKDFTY